jgi:hypothetical protein
MRRAHKYPTVYRAGVNTTRVSRSADNIKKWKFPRGEFLINMSGERQRGSEK